MILEMRQPPSLAAQHAIEREQLLALRRAISNRIERDIALLDSLDGDPDLEATAMERSGAGFMTSGPDDAEDSHDAEDDPAQRYGCADAEGVLEQFGIAIHSGCRGIA